MSDVNRLMGRPPRPARRVRTATVAESRWLTPAMVRIVVEGDDLHGLDLGAFTDHYVKCRFGELTRSYTVRDWDPERLRLTLDFVVHGDEGVAGPWAAAARPGDALQLMGPGGAYAPSPAVDWHLMVGDDAVIPAIAASLQRVRQGVPTLVVIEVAGPDHEQPLVSPGDLRLRWLHRAGPRGDPQSLLDAMDTLELPGGRGQAFVHGEAEMVLLVRRTILQRGIVAQADLSASGYWKRQRSDEQWRQEKRDWIRRAEADVPA